MINIKSHLQLKGSVHKPGMSMKHRFRQGGIEVFKTFPAIKIAFFVGFSQAFGMLANWVTCIYRPNILKIYEDLSINISNNNKI